MITALRLNGLLMALLIGLCSYGGMVMFAFYRSALSKLKLKYRRVFTDLLTTLTGTVTR